MDDNQLLQPQELGDLQADLSKKIEAEKAKEEVVTEVVSTPAWEPVVEKLTKVIEDCRSGKELKEMSRASDIDDAQLGQRYRVLEATATKIESVLQDVIETVKAHEKK